MSKKSVSKQHCVVYEGEANVFKHINPLVPSP